MRCFYQTLTHPRGGYLSTKLFIPREVWKVKNVKLKGLDEKIANCDLLTAALSKLNSVDTLDADAVLEEMQSFENVLDQAQANLSKKLGNEVGLHNISSLFKDAPASSTGIGQTNQKAGSDATSAAGINKTGSKSYLTSWRKLRSKTSSTALSTSYTNIKEVPKEGLTMHSVPMTAVISPPIRLVKRDTESMKCEGPNANYMSTLARLCDAVQVLGKSVPCLTCAWVVTTAVATELIICCTDQVARQVEDPGLKHSSPTHVGLELSARRAAEFFGFYVCRFVLQDITMLAEKFVKRASEWVLS